MRMTCKKCGVRSRFKTKEFVRYLHDDSREYVPVMKKGRGHIRVEMFRAECLNCGAVSVSVYNPVKG